MALMLCFGSNATMVTMTRQTAFTLLFSQYLYGFLFTKMVNSFFVNFSSTVCKSLTNTLAAHTESLTGASSYPGIDAPETNRPEPEVLFETAR